MEELTKIAQSILQKEAQAKGRELDLSGVKIFKVIQLDVDGDGQEEVCFAAGIPACWSAGMCGMLDPQDGAYEILTLIPLEYGFRELLITDINQDGVPEIISTWQVGSGAFLSLYIFQWERANLKSLFPENSFYQGFVELKDLDGDGVNECVIWEGLWEQGAHWEPQRFNIHIFRYNGCVYELKATQTSDYRYYPVSIITQDISSFGQPKKSQHRFTPIEEYRQRLATLIQNQQVTEKFVTELSDHHKTLQREGFYSEAVEIANLALEAVEYLDNPSIRGRFQVAIWKDKGVDLSFLGDYPTAINCYRQSLSSLTMDVATYFSVYNHPNILRELGMLYSVIGDYEHALTFLYSAQNFLKDLDFSLQENRDELSRLYSNFGLTYTRLGDWQLAISAFKEAIVLDRELGKSKGVVINYIGLGNAQRNVDYQDAIQSYQAALAVLEKVSERDRESDVYLELGFTLLLNEQIEESLKYLHKALLLTSLSNLKQHEAIHYLYIGEAYKELGDLHLAPQFFQKAIAFAQEFDTPETEWQALYGLALSYQHQGQQQKCQQALKDAIDTIEKLRSQYLPETFKISLFAEKTKPYEAMVLLCHSTSPDQAFDFMERAKSRIFIEQLATTAMGSAAGISSELAEQEAQLIGELRRLQLSHRETLSQQKYEWGDEISQIESKLEQLWQDIRRASAKGAEYVALRQATPLDFTGVKQIVNAL